jgi:myo-inositol-1(or 4)-monophosphatase
MIDFVKKFSIDLGEYIKKELGLGQKNGIYMSDEDRPIVYDIDILAEEYIRKYFNKYKPPFRVVSEDSKTYDVVKNPKFVAIIDPLDGSSNATKGIPIYNTSVAICKTDIIKNFSFDKVKIGVVYNPIKKDLYYAEYGRGAYLNNSKINTINRLNMKDWHVGSIFKLPSQQDLSFFSNFKSFRCFGCATEHICSLIRGDNQAYFAFDNKLRVYDIAAIGLILKEAGGEIENLSFTNLQFEINDKINFIAWSDKNDKKKITDLIKFS